MVTKKTIYLLLVFFILTFTINAQYKNTYYSDAAITVKYGDAVAYKSILELAKLKKKTGNSLIDYINEQSRAYLFVNKYKHAKNYNDELMQTIIKKNTVPHYLYTLVDWNIVAFDYNYETTGSAGF